jgi:hypothetical protein
LEAWLANHNRIRSTVDPEYVSIFDEGFGEDIADVNRCLAELKAVE